MAVVTFTAAGSGLWLCPSGVTLLTSVQAWGGGGGGAKGGSSAGGGGGGGEYASEASVQVTPGVLYRWTVGQGGPGGTGSGSNAGGTSSFAADTLSVAAHGGDSGGGDRQGGSGSTNTTHFSGGSGGTGFHDFAGGAGGGGASAGFAAGGGNGGNGTASSPGSNGAAPTGGGNGGFGGEATFPGTGGNGLVPGGGGGGGSVGFPGGGGAAGMVQLTYSAPQQPQVPAFPAGYAPVSADFDGWIQAPNSFFTSGRPVFRAELTTAKAMPNNTNTVLPFDAILEDPYSGWQPGSSQWLAPQNGVYSVTLTVSCAANASQPVVSARVGVDSSSQLMTVSKAWVPSASVPGMASGAVPVYLYGGQDSVQGIGFSVGGAGTTVSTAGQRCRMSIMYTSE